MPYKDPKRKTEYMKNYQQENREKINAINKKSREKTNRSSKDKERYALDEEYRQKILEKNREQSKKHREKRTETQRIRRQERRKFLIEHLGGKCVGCGAIENLQFDHIDRKQKSFTIGKCWGYTLEKLIEEAEKCQLLCKECHQYKTTINHDTNMIADGYKVKEVKQVGEEIVVTLHKVAQSV